MTAKKLYMLFRGLYREYTTFSHFLQHTTVPSSALTNDYDIGNTVKDIPHIR